MRPGLFVSTAGHALLLGWGLVSFSGSEPLNVEFVDALPIEFVTVSDVTDLQKGIKTAEEVIPEAASVAEPTDTPVEPAPDDAGPRDEPVEDNTAVPDAKAAKEAVPDEPTPPPPQPEPEPEIEPEAKLTPPVPTPPVPREVAKIEPEPEVAEDKPALEEAKPAPPVPKSAPRPKVKTARVEPPKKKKPPREQAELLDKKDAASSAAGRSSQQASLGSKKGRAGGAMTQSELDYLVSQIRACWNPPAGVVGRDFKITLQMQMAPDGALRAAPQIKAVEGLEGAVVNAAAGAASRAVRRCAPYTLPAEKYADGWDVINVNFTPN